MTKINSVLGSLDTSELGPTLMHEHILAVNWAMRQCIAGWFDKEAFIKEASEQLLLAKKAGIKTIVDPTTISLGRDVNLLREVAEKTEMQIIVATGCYWTDDLSFLYWETDRIVDALLQDIEKGIQGTTIKAGIIKCATDKAGVTPQNRKQLKVAARLHKLTGLPITTHTHAAEKNGIDQQALFREEGVDPSRVIIGHTGDTEDLEYIETLISAGSYVGMDRFGLDVILPNDARLDTVKKLCESGRADRLFLSHDATVFTDWFSEGLKETYMPNWHIRFISESVLPALREKGVTEKQINQMMVDNPRRFFSTE
jgi:phosphotriesterase-related protein